MKLLQAATVLGLAFQGVSATTPPPGSPELEKPGCCAALAEEKLLHGKVLAKDSEEYDARLETYYSANAALPAWCMVLPESTQDVSKLANILHENDCPFGIRSGAHSAFKNSNAVEHGVTIDFSYMNGTTYDAENKIASIQPGSQAEAVYRALDPHGVTVPGPRASVVGIGGFTTGGGYTFYSNSHGFFCDTVVNWEIVLADGTVVNANEKENPDLWKAQKGGSGNLGFVTRIDQVIIESTQIWGGFLTYDLEKKDAIFDAYINFAEKMGDDPASEEIVALYYDPTGFSVRSILTNTDAIDSAPAFNEFNAIDTTDSTVNTTSIAEFVPQFTGPTPLGLYANWFTGTTTNDVRVLKLIDKKLNTYAKQMQAAAPDSEFNILIQFQPIPASFVQHSKERGGNVLGLEDQVTDGPLLMWLISLTVDTEENQEKILPLGLELRDAINEEASGLGVNKDWFYLNYAWKDQDPLSRFGDENISLLKSMSRKFDPSGFFQKQRGSGFKIPV